MTKTIVQTYNIANHYSKKAFYIGVVSCALFLVSYCIGVYRVISQTMSLQKIENQESVLSLSVQALDKQYIDLSSKITPDVIASYGFREVEVNNFIEKSSSLGRIAQSEHEL